MSAAAPPVRAMTRAELAIVLGWAEAEGWNPGRDDASLFHAADPEGFMVARDDGAPVAAVAVVRIDRRHAFLGLYLCRPGWRGRGFGTAVWRAGMARMQGVAVGLDGVPAQQDSYARAGFAYCHRTLRFAGVPDIAATPGAAPRADAAITAPLAPGDIAAACTLDRRASGFERPAFLRRWLTPGPGRRARVRRGADGLRGVGAMRRCVEGWKIGPVRAASDADAAALIRDLARDAGGAPIMIDVPEPNTAAIAIAGQLGLAPVFETARMWRGAPPAGDIARDYAVCSLELG